MTAPDANVVTVVIAGAEYTLRAQATPEYARKCAEYLDRVISEIRQQAPSGMEIERLAILAGLSLADQLLRTRESLESLNRVANEIEARLTDAHLAAPS
jgi:cell division protein ZapA (FtsZ GTPase activity inhibitor)